MTHRMMILIGLLIVAVTVVGAGVGLMATPSPALKIPQAPPIISAEAYWHMAGHKQRVLIYEDGSVICVEDSNLRVPSPDRPLTTVWKKGALSQQEVDELLGVAMGGEFLALDQSYRYDGNPSSDLWFTVVVRYGTTEKSVRADGYMSQDKGVTYPDMPHPLDDIYAWLHDIALNQTKEVARETVRG